MANVKITKSWFIKARDDLFTAQVLFDSKHERVWPQTAFLCQQSIEKAMKGHLVSIGKRPGKTHDLKRLADEICEAGTSIEIIKSNYPEWEAIEKFAVLYRYPGAENVSPITEEKLKSILPLTKNLYDALLAISVEDSSSLR